MKCFVFFTASGFSFRFRAARWNSPFSLSIFSTSLSGARRSTVAVTPLSCSFNWER